MAQIKKRTTSSGEARYDVLARMGARTITRTFKRRRDADAFATTLEADRLRGMAIDPRAGRSRFEDYARSWLSRRPELSVTTRHDYRKLLDNHLVPEFGTAEIAAIAPSAIRGWWAALATSSPARAAKAYRLLRAILNTAVADGLLGRNPCQVARAGQERSPERPTATVAEVQTLADSLPDRLSLAVRLAAFCGLRRGELLALRRRDIDVLHRQLHVERSLVYLADGSILAKSPKTTAGRRRIAIPPHLVPHIEEHLANHTPPETDSLLFTGEKGGPLRPHVLQAEWNKARRSIGRPDLHLHDLRHSGNTWAAATGASTAELMARMGHASPAAALRYQHATEERDRVIADALSAMVEPAPVEPITPVARDGRAMEPSEAEFPTAADTAQTQVAQGNFGEQPQRDSNPCLHLERVVS
jgi:integrase